LYRSSYREAIIHFELYRLLKACLVSGGYSNIEVEPELVVGNGSADLVLTRREGGKDEHLIVIEVKSGLKELSAYDNKAREQVKAYANNLNADYCAVTNGHFVGLFNRTGKDFGYYHFELSEDCVKRFLDDLFKIIAGEKEKLSLPVAPSREEIGKSANNLAKAVREVLEGLDGRRGFRLETEVKKETRMFYLSVGKFRRVFRLGIPLTISLENRPGVDIRLNTLKRRLDLVTIQKLINELSKIPGFEWAKGTEIKKEFIWRYLTPIKEVNAEKLKKGLTDWLLKLSTLADIE